MPDADSYTETPHTRPAEDGHGEDAPEVGQAADAPDTGDERRPGESASGEAAKWRRRLRDTERERDDLAARLDTMQRRELGRLATTPGSDEHGRPVPALFDVADVFAPDADLADLLDDDGQLDESRVRATIAAATDGRGHMRADLAPRPPSPTRAQGSSGSPTGGRSTGEGWQSLLRGGR